MKLFTHCDQYGHSLGKETPCGGKVFIPLVRWYVIEGVHLLQDREPINAGSVCENHTTDFKALGQRKGLFEFEVITLQPLGEISNGNPEGISLSKEQENRINY